MGGFRGRLWGIFQGIFIKYFSVFHTWVVQLKRDTYLNRLRNHQDTVHLHRQCLFYFSFFIPLFIVCGFFPVTVSN